MIPASFDYHRPATVAEAIALMSEHGEEARLLAGGHSLLPAMKLRFNTPTHLIDIGALPDFAVIREEGDTLVIGAGATHASLETSALLQSSASALAQAAAVIGDVQVRNRGTLGGSLAHADPSADYPAALLALSAEIVLQGEDGKRTVSAAEFFIDLFTTALEAGELVVEVRLPKQGAAKSAYQKFPQPASRFAVVGCAALLEQEGDRCTRARVAFTGVTGAAFCDEALGAFLVGKQLSPQVIDEAAAMAGAELDPEDINADNFAAADYRAHLMCVYAKRVLQPLTS